MVEGLETQYSVVYSPVVPMHMTMCVQHTYVLKGLYSRGVKLQARGLLLAHCWSDVNNLILPLG